MMEAKHPGQSSGCQGCDPGVAMPTLTDRPFLCQACQRWMEVRFAEVIGAENVRRSPLDILAERRAMRTETV